MTTLLTQSGQPYVLKRRATASEILNNDKDREALYQKIVELLIAAGYYRARVQSLEPFDKILGGIVWTLTGSFYDIDIEFKDEMNLTEKIKVSEKITAALKTVNCPFNISPVQIQGLDLPIIFQVLQWLVKMLMDTRDERNYVNRKNAQNYFKQNLNLHNNTKLPSSDLKDSITSTKYSFFSTGRLFRPTNTHNFSYNDPLRVYFTLIEHGLNKDLSFQRTLIDLLKKKNLIEDKTKPSQTTTADHPTKAEAQVSISPEEKKKLEEVLSTNIVEVSSKNRVSTSVIEEIFSENIESIINEIDKYENLKGDENIDRIKLFIKEKDRLESNKVNIMTQIKDYESELEYVDDKIDNTLMQINNSDLEIVKLNKTLEENANNLQKLSQKISQAKVSEEKMLIVGEKIKQREELKSAIAKFKKDCLEEKKSYDNQLQVLEKKIEKMNDSDNTQVFEEIDRNYQNEYEKMVIKKKDLFEQNKIINLLTRKIQVFPSKLELIQYQKRFQELYDQINNVSEKSRKFLNEINSRDEVIKLLNQKLDVFIQLREAYKNSKTKKDKEDFKDSLHGVLETIAQSIRKWNERTRQFNSDMEENQSKLNELQLYENKYMKLIKEYNKEYNKFNYSKFN